MPVTYSPLLNFTVSMRSLAESETNFRYDKSALLQLVFIEIYLKQNREISKLTTHTVIQVDMYTMRVFQLMTEKL